MSSKLAKQLGSLNTKGIHIKKTDMHPRWQEILEIVQEQMKIIGISAKMAEDMAGFSLYSYPFISIEMAIFIVYWDIWAFLLDDVIEKRPEEYVIWMKYLDEGSCPDLGKLEKLYLLVMKTARNVFKSKEFIDEFVLLMKDWLESYQILHNKTKNQIPIPDEEFWVLRLKDGAVLLFELYLRIDCGLKLSDPNLASFIHETGKHFMLINDMFSLKKEVKEDDFFLNYVLILTDRNKLTAQQAVDRIIVEAKECERKGLYLGEKLKSVNDDALNRYVDMMIAVMYGNLYWSSICKRYNPE